MKKKHRDITVDGEAYAWKVCGIDDVTGEIGLRIWKDGKIFHDWMHDVTVITPKHVEETINAVNGLRDKLKSNP